MRSEIRRTGKLPKETPLVRKRYLILQEEYKGNPEAYVDYCETLRTAKERVNWFMQEFGMECVIFDNREVA